MRTRRARRAAFVAFVFGVVAFAYAPVLRNGFVEYDDQAYVYENDLVRGGLAPGSLRDAFVHTVSGNWHPLALLSHMLDCTLFGLNPSGHHLTSLLLHAVNTALLFLLLEGATAAAWPSALAALLFGLHPLNVDSVAWIAERKNVLSTLFWLSATCAYFRYARSPSARNLFPTLILMLLGLMSKAALMMFPFALLALDAWPLGRWTVAGVGRTGTGELLGEKRALFILAAVGAAAAIKTQRTGEAIALGSSFPVAWRIPYALDNYVHYLRKALWPADLAVLYPRPEAPLSLGILALDVLLLAAITLAVVRLRRKRPYLLAGWLWYAVTLFPTCGLLVLGRTIKADRYAYVPCIGVFFAAAWLLGDLAARGRRARAAVIAAAAAGCVALGALARQQVACWRDSIALFSHAVEVTKDNFWMQDNLGRALLDSGRLAEGVAHLREAVRIAPGVADLRSNLGRGLFLAGEYGEAEEHLRRAIEMEPDDAELRFNLALVLEAAGRYGDADALFEQAGQMARRAGDEGLVQRMRACRADLRAGRRMRR
jgi:tetratricopeptide (TPR) repeat protein